MPTPASAKRGRPAELGLVERRREEILSIATGLIASAGYPSTDLQDVADRLGVGKGTIYRYFPTKQALFHAAVGRVMTGLRTAIDAASEGVEDPLARVATAVREYLQYFDRHPEFIEVLIQERAQLAGRSKASYFEHREAGRGPWRELYRGLIAKGRVRDIPLDRIMDTLGALVYGAMFTNYFAGRRQPLMAQADDILDVVFNGLLTPAEQERRRRPARKGEGR